MLLIGKLATSHGAERTARGKRVWAELAIPTQSVTRRLILSTSRRVVRAALRALPRPGKPPIPVCAAGSSRPRTAAWTGYHPPRWETPR